jgi:hypothetical protein
MHYQKQSLHRESGASPRAKAPALGESSLRREHMVWLSAKHWPMVKSPFAESILLSAPSERFSWRCHHRKRNGRLRPLNSPRAKCTWLSAKKYTRRRGHFHREHYIFGECFDSAHDDFFKKNFTFSSSNFFLDPHTLIQCACSKLAPFCLYLLYLTISLHSLYLFLIRPIWTASA